MKDQEVVLRRVKRYLRFIEEHLKMVTSLTPIKIDKILLALFLGRAESLRGGRKDLQA